MHPEWNLAIMVVFIDLPSVEGLFQRSFLLSGICNISGCQNPKYVKVFEDDCAPCREERN